MTDDTGLYPRTAAPALLDALAAATAVLLHGPRGAGKRTLAAMTGEMEEYALVSLEDASVFAAASRDPAGFVWELPDRVIVEEVQRMPPLLAALAREAGRHPSPGRFLVTSTGNVSLDGAWPEGVELLRLDPFSQSELGEWNSAFLDCLFAAELGEGPAERLGFELLERIVDGGFIEAVFEATPAARGDWYRAYVADAVERDVAEQSRLRLPGLLVDVLQHASASTGDLLNSAALAAPFRVSRPTIHDYVHRLERVHLIDLLPAWTAAADLRLVTSPRLHIADPGIAAALQGITAESLAEDRAQLHSLLATFAVQEVRRQAVGYPEPLAFSHLRDRDGANVDLVIERGDGVTAGVCVLTGGTVTARDFRGLRKLRAAAGDAFVAGVVLYDGEATVAFDDGLFALPMRSLWELI